MPAAASAGRARPTTEDPNYRMQAMPGFDQGAAMSGQDAARFGSPHPIRKGRLRQLSSLAILCSDPDRQALLAAQGFAARPLDPAIEALRWTRPAWLTCHFSRPGPTPVRTFRPRHSPMCLPRLSSTCIRRLLLWRPACPWSFHDAPAVAWAPRRSPSGTASSRKRPDSLVRRGATGPRRLDAQIRTKQVS